MDEFSLGELKKTLESQGEDQDFETLLRLFTREGETRRLSALSPQEKLFIFELMVTHKTYFEDTGIPEYKPIIPGVCELYLDLAVSETQNKDKNLLQTIAEVMQTKFIYGGGQDGVEQK